MEGISCEDDAVYMFQGLVRKGFISHASGSVNHPFIYGYYFYFLVDKNNATYLENADLNVFRREWVEVELRSCYNVPYCEFDDSEVQEACTSFSPKKKTFTFNKTTLDLDSGTKSGRAEWVHVKYQNVYYPEQAFEINLEWMVATSNQIAEIIKGWSRKAGSSELHLVPIPSDPFALPFSSRSDPLRGPMFVPLNLECLPSEMLQNMNRENMLRFRETLLSTFGFVPFHECSNEQQRQYVHVSGGIFVLIPNRTSSEYKINDGTDQPPEMEQVRSPHEEYLTRHFSGTMQTEKRYKKVRVKSIF